MREQRGGGAGEGDRESKERAWEKERERIGEENWQRERESEQRIWE